MTATAAALRALAVPLRRRNAVAWALGAVGVTAFCLALAAWAARLGWYDEPAWVLLAWAAALVVAALLTWTGVRRTIALSALYLARYLEELGRWRRGALTAFLEPAAQGTSAALLADADRQCADEVLRSGQDAVVPVARSLRTRTSVAALILLAGLAAFWSAGPVRGVAAALWHPAQAWAATIAPIRISAESQTIERGASARLDLQALGRRRAVLWLRAPGEAWRGQAVELDSLGHASRTVGPLETDLLARVTSGDRTSATLRIAVRIPAFLGSLAVTARFPRYLGLEDEPIPTSGDTVLLPAGTRLEASGEATTALGTARWRLPAGGQPAAMEIAGNRFSGSFVPAASGVYGLELVTREGNVLAGDPVRIPLRVVPDSAPTVEVPVPGADTVAPLSLRVPLVIDARDDHGLSQVMIESHRVSRLGFADPPKREMVVLPGHLPDRAILSFEFDLNQRGLLPGDTIRYFARALDNAPRAGEARSREYVLRLPTLSEMRAATRQATEGLAAALDSVSGQSRMLERQTESLAQERARQNADRRAGTTDASLSFEASKRAQAVAATQEELIKRAESVARALDELQRSAEASGINDPAFQQRLEEIRKEIDRALSPELREKLAELQKALKELDPERTRDALANLAEAQKRLREAIEQSRELFRRAALEGDLANLSAESKELVREQREWTDRVTASDSARAAAQEAQLAARADSLSSALSRVAQDAAPKAAEARDRLEGAAAQASQAGEQMSQAAQSAKAGRRGQARQHGQKALQSLQPLGEQLEQGRQELQQEWRQEVVEALDRALTDASRLTRRQLKVADELKDGTTPAAARAEQAAVEEGVQRVLDQIKDASGKNALVSPQAGAALAAAQQEMRQAREALETPAPNSREAADHAGQAVDAMNAATFQLVRSRGDVAGSGSGSGLQEALERMSQIASRQGQLGAQAGGLLPMAGNSGAIQSQLQQLAARQRAIAEEMQRLRATGNTPGAGAMADEAQDLAQRLEAGRLDRQVVERQERLFRRMLDAGRTLQGQEEDPNKERQSTTARDDSISLPPALRARLQGAGDRLTLPSWETLQRLSPEERRLVVEYFRRLTESPRSQR